ncbi:hypothetical protein E4U61_005563 [Claviceps capensis]|nr:hypothetical protein E4U61_005563 [Claviceps capensis]
MAVHLSTWRPSTQLRSIPLSTAANASTSAYASANHDASAHQPPGLTDAQRTLTQLSYTPAGPSAPGPSAYRGHVYGQATTDHLAQHQQADDRIRRIITDSAREYPEKEKLRVPDDLLPLAFPTMLTDNALTYYTDVLAPTTMSFEELASVIQGGHWTDPG